MPFLISLVVAVSTAGAAPAATPLSLSASCSARLEPSADSIRLVIRDAGRDRIQLRDLPETTRLRLAGDILHLDGTGHPPLHFRDLCTYPMN